MIVGHRVRDELFWFVGMAQKDAKELKAQGKEGKKLRKKQIMLKRRIQNDLKD